MTVRAFIRAVGCLPLALGVVSCGNGESQVSPDAIHMAFIPKTSANLVFKIGNDGAQFGARALSHTSGREVKVEYLAPDTLSPAMQRGYIEQAVSAKRDALLVSCLDESMTTSVDQAVEAGIPVITYDSDCPNSKRLGFYSMRSDATGAKAADLLAAAMGSGAKTVAVLTGRAGAENLEGRVAGFMGRLAAAYPQISVAATVHCAETAETCGPALEDEVIAEHPDLDGLFVVGLWGLLAACECNESGMTCTCDDSQMPQWKSAARGKLKTVAYDSLPFELTLMKQGYVSALIGQKYFGWGYETVSIMFEHLTTGRAVGSFIDSGFDVVCPNNVEDMASKWEAADFRTPLAPDCAL